MIRLLKKIFLLLISIYLTGAAWAQTDVNTELKSEFKALIIDLVKVDVKTTQMQILEKAGFNEKQIMEIISSPSFGRFVDNVVHDPRVVGKIDHQIDELLKPGYLETEIRRETEALEAQRRQDILFALRELARFQNRPVKQLAAEPEPILTRFWKKFKKDIFG